MTTIAVDLNTKPVALRRTLSWAGAFWIVSGIAPLVLFSIGAVGAIAGKMSWLIWVVSMLIGLVQSVVFAEIAAMHPKHAGGVAVHAGIAWKRYGKPLAPLCPWAYWVGWTVVLAVGSSLAAGYILSLLLPPDAAARVWQLQFLDLSFLKTGLTVRINLVSILAFVLLVATFWIQHRGILLTSKIQKILAVATLVPLLLVSLAPLFTGAVPRDHFLPLVPSIHNAQGGVTDGSWNLAGITAIAAGLFIAGWSTYGVETAACFTREFKVPRKDTARSIGAVAVLCLLFYTLVPLTFQGVLGLEGLNRSEINDGSGVGLVLAGMLPAWPYTANIIVAILVLALFLSMTSIMAGSARTLYQSSVEGWFPRYLSRTNRQGSPTYAMATDLAVNACLLLLSDSMFVLAAANVCYMVFVFLALNALWILRRDCPQEDRPFRMPTWALVFAPLLAFLNAFLIGMGAGSYGRGTLLTGLVVLLAIFPVIALQHFRPGTPKVTPAPEVISPASGKWPWITLILGVMTVYAGFLVARN